MSESHSLFSGNWCSKNVVVRGSESVKSSTDGASPLRCKCLRNIVESEIFKSSQKSSQGYESAVLTLSGCTVVAHNVSRLFIAFAASALAAFT